MIWRSEHAGIPATRAVTDGSGAVPADLGILAVIEGGGSGRDAGIRAVIEGVGSGRNIGIRVVMEGGGSGQDIGIRAVIEGGGQVTSRVPAWTAKAASGGS